jgi:hypothetical protein
VPFPTYDATILADSPIDFWRCNGDEPTFGGPLTHVTGPASDGEQGCQTSVSGAGNCVETPLQNPDGSTGISGTGPFTIEFWFQVPSYTGNDPVTLVGSGTVFSTGFFMDVGSGGGYTCTYGGNGLLSGNGPVAAGVWHYALLRFDGSKVTLTVDLFDIDSEPVPDSHGDTFAASIGQQICFGAIKTGISLTDATICDFAKIAFYNYYLTDEQMMTHYSAASAIAATYPIPVADTYAQAVLFDRPIAYYRVGETAGTRAFDASGNGNNGAYLPVTTDDEPSLLPGGYDAAILLDGVGGSLNTPLTVLSTLDKFSIEGWFYAQNVGSGNIALCKNRTWDTGVYVFVNASGQLVFNAGNESCASAASSIVNSQVYYFAATFDGTNLRLYINGSLVAIHSAGTVPTWGDRFSFGASYAIEPGHGVEGWFFHGNLDELALYNHVLPAARIAAHYAAASGPPPAPNPWGVAGDDRHYWLIEIYDGDGNLVDIPQADVVNFEFGDTLNGGSNNNSKILLRRDIDNVGAIQFQYRVLFWFWNGRIAKPVDPYYGGYILNIDQERLKSDGVVTIYVAGNARLLDAALVDIPQFNPGIAGNPNVDAADFIRWLFANYAPPDFGNLKCPSSLFDMWPSQFAKMKLGAVIDTILKSGRDGSGNLFTWAARTAADLTRTLVVQPDQNPNVFGTLHFIHVFPTPQCTKYLIQTKTDGLVNVVLVTGGTDPETGNTVEAVFEDTGSVAEWGPIEDAISVPAVCSPTAAVTYGETYLDIHANPQATGQIDLAVPDPSIVAGTWLQFWETPDNGSGDSAIIKQVRVSDVIIRPKKGRLTQTLSTVAPIPYLDEAVYRTGLAYTNAAANLVRNLPVNTQQQYVRSGGVITY